MTAPNAPLGANAETSAPDERPRDEPPLPLSPAASAIISGQDEAQTGLDRLLNQEVGRRPIFSEVILGAVWIVTLVLVTRYLRGPRGGGDSAIPWVFALVTGAMVILVIAFGRVSRRRIAGGMSDADEALRSMELVTDPALSFLPLDDLLNELLVRTGQVVKADIALIQLLSEDAKTLALRAVRGLDGSCRPGTTVALGDGIVSAVAARGDGMIMNEGADVASLVPEAPGHIAALLAAPLLVRERVTGVVVIGSSSPRRFRRRDLQLLKLVADRLAVAIERGRLDDAERRSRLGAAHARLHLQLLARAADALGPALESYDEALQDLEQVVVPSFADWFAIDLVGDDGLVHRVAVGPTSPTFAPSGGRNAPADDRHRHPDGERIVREVIDSGQTKVFMDPRRLGPDHDGEPAAPGRFEANTPALGIDSMLVVPIHVRGLSLGAMSFVTGLGRRGYRRSDLDAARSLAGRVGVAIERVLLWRDGRETERAATRHAEQLSRLVDAALAVSVPLNEPEVLNLLAEHARRMLEAERAIVFSADDPAEVEAAATIGPGATQNALALAARHLVSEGRRPMRSSERSSESSIDSMWAWAENASSRQWVGMPVRSEGNVSGRVLVVIGHVGQTFDAEDESMLILLGQMAASALDNVRLYETIHQNEQRLAAAVDSSPLAITELDLVGAARWWNPAAEELFGWSASAPNPHIPDLDLDPSTLEDAIGRAALGEAVVGLPIRSAHADGSALELSVSLAPLGRDDHAVGGILALVEDVTERKAMWDQVQRTERLGAMARLAGGIAHDFNNLLTVILGSNEIAQRVLAARGEAAANEELGAIRRAGERAAELTSRLLAIGHRGLMEPVIVDPDVVVKDMEPIFRRILGEEVAVEVICSPEPLTILVDPAELERAILNLAINARDAMPRGGRFSIRTELLPAVGDQGEGPIVAIAIADTGVGMDPSVAEHCFEPLFTTKPSGQGTGLGLTAVHAAVSQAGGRVTIDTAPELGTTFTLSFPWADGTVEPPEPDEALVTGGDEVLLLVEDEAELRELAVRELSWRGYTVVSAASGLEAIAAAERIEGRFDLLVTDIAMPGMSGLELSGKLASRWGAFPILYVSGHIDRATLDAHELDGEGVSALAKPFTPEQLARRVRRALEVDHGSKR